MTALLAIAALSFLQNPNPAYVLGADSNPKPGIPKGTTTKYTWATSKIFPGTTRDYWIYVPAQYDGTKPACLMIFQDGAGHVSETGNGSHGTVVFDNLIADKSIPVTIGLFISPGVTPPITPQQMGRYHRSHEYDAINDLYARFLIEEMIPEVSKQYKISSDPNDRGLAGGSSGAIAAFVAAWQRPDAFRRVISFIGSYAGLRGGDTLSNMIRKVEPKPLRIFMQDGSADQSIYGGSWFQANESLAASLEYSGYDMKFVIGTEGHSGRHGAAILPEALRWLWREYPKPIAVSKGGPGVRHYITDFLDPNSDWEVVSEGHGATGATAVGKDGALYFADTKLGKILKIVPGAKAAVFKENAPASALMSDAEGRLYAAQPSRKRIVSWAADGTGEQTIATAVNAHALAVTSQGAVYFLDPATKQIWVIGKDKKKRMVLQTTLQYPSALRLSPDEHLMDIADRDARWIWSYQVAPDHSLQAGLAFHHLESPDESSVTNALALTHDNTGHVYASTGMGIQIADPPGRIVGIIRNPEPGTASSIVFGGKDMRTLYATIGGKVYGRNLRRTGNYPWRPTTPPRPGL